MPGTIIIGNGISGISAAIQLRAISDQEILIISSESKYFYSRTALMYIYMGQLTFDNTKPHEDSFWQENNLKLIYDHVTQINRNEKKILLKKSGTELQYDKLVIATGSRSRRGDWKGEELKGVNRLYSLQDLRKIEEQTLGIEDAIIIGGGLIGIELCEMLRSRGINVTFLIREPRFMPQLFSSRESSALEKHFIDHGVNLIKDCTVDSFRADQKGNLYAVRTSSGTEYRCSFAGVTIGVEPNIGLMKNTGIEINNGILVDEFLCTTDKHIYAVGDCAEVRFPKKGRRAIEPVWYSGKLMGTVAAFNICGIKKEYDPGLWFNSAKFFDLEYQVYGMVSSEDDDLEDFYWFEERPSRSVRISFKKESHQVTGVNFIGIRARHALCDRLIRKNVQLDRFIDQIGHIIFDQELTKSPVKAIKQHFSNFLHITN